MRVPGIAQPMYRYDSFRQPTSPLWHSESSLKKKKNIKRLDQTVANVRLISNWKTLTLPTLFKLSVGVPLPNFTAPNFRRNYLLWNLFVIILISFSTCVCYLQTIYVFSLVFELYKTRHHTTYLFLLLAFSCHILRFFF